MFHVSGRGLYLAVAIAASMLVPSATAQAAPETFEGTLLVTWGDPHPDSGAAGVISYMLALPDGRQVALQMPGREHEALSYFGKSVTVTGTLTAARSTAAVSPAPEVIVVDAIGPSRMPPSASDLRASLAVSGSRRVVFLLLKFADDASVPHPPAFFTDLTNPDTPPVGASFPATINGFFKKTSANQFAWTADVAGAGGVGAPGGWLTLPQPKSYYANCNFSVSCADLTRITADAVAAGKAQGLTFTSYDNINFVFSNDLDCCAWGGSRMIDGKVFGVTFEPPWGQETRTYAHEMGHSLGLPHSGWVYFSYDSPWDVMSGSSDAVSTTCGSYLSRNSNGAATTLRCKEPGNGYIAAHRDYLGWLPAPNVVVTDANAAVTVTLEGAALPLGSSTKMIKVCLPGVPCSGGTAHYFTVEARVRGGAAATLYDNGIPGEGIIIHDVQFNRPRISGACYFNDQSGWAVPVDATPGDYDTAGCGAGGRQYPNYGLYNAQFVAGQTYTNSAFGFSITVLARVGSTFVVAVKGSVVSDLSLDSPSNGTVVGRPFTISGWALGRSATSGTGVDAVHVYAVPGGGGAAVFLGVAAYGTPRPDVAALFGSQFTNCGFTLTAGNGLAPGGYTVYAYGHNTATGAFDVVRSASVTIPAPVSHPFINVDTPAPSAVVTSAFEVGGWALDAGAPSGTGVDAVQFYIFPSDGAGGPVFIGTGSYGAARADVGGIFGSRFANSGFHFTITGMAPGAYLLGVYAHSTVTNSYSVVQTVHIRVNANALMSIDVPAAEATITTPDFGISGWAIDRAAAGGTGVDQLHVYAYPNPGSGAPAIFLGIATLGIARGDVAALYGASFTNSGYVLNVNAPAAGLTPGVYNLVVWAHSTATNTFNNFALVRVTIQ